MNSRVVVPSVLVAISALLSACTNMPGSAGSAPKDALSRITQTQTLTLGYREDSKPFSFKGDDGNPAGYSVDLCKRVAAALQDRKSTRLNSSHLGISYAVFCL